MLNRIKIDYKTPEQNYNYKPDQLINNKDFLDNNKKIFELIQKSLYLVNDDEYQQIIKILNQINRDIKLPNQQTNNYYLQYKKQMNFLL